MSELPLLKVVILNLSAGLPCQCWKEQYICSKLLIASWRVRWVLIQKRMNSAFFWAGRRRKALMLPSFWVILYISQVILPYLPCKKQQAVVVLLLIAAVIKTLQLERSGRLWWWIKQQRAYLTLLSSYCLTCTHINRILIWLLSWVKHKDFRKKQLISWAKKEKTHNFNMLTFWFRTTLKFLIMIHFFFFSFLNFILSD